MGAVQSDIYRVATGLSNLMWTISPTGISRVPETGGQMSEPLPVFGTGTKLTTELRLFRDNRRRGAAIRKLIFLVCAEGKSEIATVSKTPSDTFPGGGIAEVYCTILGPNNLYKKAVLYIAYFYSRFQVDDEDDTTMVTALKNMSALDKQFTQKLPYSTLCFLLKVLIKRGIIKPDTNVCLFAGGKARGKHKKEEQFKPGSPEAIAQMAGLINIYKGYGFVSEKKEPQYMNARADHLIATCGQKAKHAFTTDTMSVVEGVVKEEAANFAMRRKKRRRRARAAAATRRRRRSRY